MIDPTQWLDGMLGALEDEIQAKRSPKGAERILLGDGIRRNGRQRDSFVYRFRVRDGDRMPVFTGGVLRAPDSQGVDVTFHARGEGRILDLAVPLDLGPRVKEAELSYYDDGLLRMIRHRVREFREPLQDLMDTVFPSGTTEFVTASSHTVEPIPFSAEGLNSEQVQAVRDALRLRIHRIWGPPGTGKTRTAARLASALIQAGRRVVLAGPTHRSADLLLLAVIQDLDWTPAEVDGRIVRLGDMVLRDLRADWGELVEYDHVCERERRALTDRIAELEAELNGRQQAEDPLSSDAPRVLRAEVHQQLRALYDRVDGVPERVLARAQVVGVTAHRVALGQVPPVDHVVLDEASMVNLPLTLLTALGGSRLTLVGDPRQAGPVYHARTPRARRWLGRTLLEASSGEQPAASHAATMPAVTQLTRQYRMPGPVCALVSRLSYAGRLKSEASSERRAGVLPSPLMFLNLAGRAPASRRPQWPREGREQADLLMGIIAGLIPAVANSAERPAVITPYRAHVRALWLAADRRGIRDGVEVSTVHRFQGRERRCVFLSLPERCGEPLSPFLRATRIDQDGGRLLTVALSRASEHLMVVGDLTWLAQAAPTQGVLMHFLRLLKELGDPWLTHVERPCPLENELPNPRNTLGDLHENGPKRGSRRTRWKGSRHRRST